MRTDFERRNAWTKRPKAAVAAVFVIMIALNVAGGMSSPALLILPVLITAMEACVLLRYGLVAFAGGILSADMLMDFPITTQPSAWYFGIGLTRIVLLFALTF
jgi:hypothetical protein